MDNIEKMIETAYLHMLENNCNHIDLHAITFRYAKEAKGMSDELAKIYADMANDSETEGADNEEFEKFYAWYYLNVVIEDYDKWDAGMTAEQVKQDFINYFKSKA